MTLRRSLSPALLALLTLALLFPAGAHAAPADEDGRVFVQRAAGAELARTDQASRYQLTLTGLDLSVASFVETPARAADEEQFAAFWRRWDERGLDAADPNAALVLREGFPRNVMLLQITDRGTYNVTEKSVTYTVAPLQGPVTGAVAEFTGRRTPVELGDLGPASLFIDDPPPPVPGRSTLEEFRDVATEWSGIAGILFMVAILALLWRSLRLMPKTKPQTLKPAEKSSVRWEDIAGAGDAKEELQEVVQFLKDPKRFRRFGAQMPTGVLLHGPPGTGKTLLAKAVAHESGAYFLSQSASSFVEMFAGLGAARIRRLFNEARKHSPAIVFIDELDAVGTRRTGSDTGDREQTLNQLLVEMDGFAGTEDVVVMAASNLLDKLDPALLRPGRFDRQVFVSPPDVAGREEILEVHTNGKPLHDVDLRTIAAQTSGLTGADLANLCNEAAIFAARRDGVAITQADFDMALERVIAGVQSKRVLQPAEKRVVAYHEAGHALCGELLASVDKVHKISIVPRGTALGFTLNLPEEDRYLKTREELLDHMAMLLGGRVAEQIVFGKITTGASDDLKRVAELTHAMVHEYAMGTADSAQRGAYETGQASEVTRRIRDEEQRELAFEAQAMAERLITDHRELLEELAQSLLEHEVLERAQIDEIMHGTAPVTDRPRLTGLPLITAAEELPGKDT
ncbi:MAG: ATP-dependent metallopeptidase FtsH/Yme1/Tma family protein [Solirubrobacteraceae bacterium]